MNQRNARICRHRADAAAWVLDDLAPAEAGRFENHLARCPDCARDVQALSETVRRLRACPVREPDAGLTGRIMQAVRDADRAASNGTDGATRPPARLETWAKPWRLARPAQLALAASLVLLLGAWFAVRIGERRDAAARQSLTLGRSADQAACWIAGQQEADGSWRPSRSGGADAYRPALTALSILALCRQAPERHAEAIRRGVRALTAMQTRDGAFGDHPHGRLYNHAFAGQVLFALPPAFVRMPGVGQARDQAIAFSLAMQNDQGGWDYTRDGTGNTALSVWQIALLTQARAQGWEDRHGHLRRGLAWLGQQNDGRAYGYRTPGVSVPGRGSLTLTAMAAATLLDAARTYPALTSVARSAADMVRELHLRQPAEGSDYYRDYFLARVASLTADRQNLADVMERLLAQCVFSTDRDAHWIADDSWRQPGGDLYATTMAVLSPRL